MKKCIFSAMVAIAVLSACNNGPGDLPKEITKNDIRMVYIPKGTFTMGSPETETIRLVTETEHQVTLTKGFYMGKYEITNAQYAAFLNANSIKDDGKGSVTYYEDNSKEPTTKTQPFITPHEWGVKWDAGQWIPAEGKGDFPVINVTWYGAKAFADWMGGSLPTEAQWEYACRAGTTTAFSFGDKDADLGQYGWFADNSDNTTHTVGGKQPNAWGLYDMHGNVWEWCSDWYGAYTADAATDPTGAATGSDRVLRGGSYASYDRYCRSANRFFTRPNQTYDHVGFRVVYVP